MSVFLSNKTGKILMTYPDINYLSVGDFILINSFNEVEYIIVKKRFNTTCNTIEYFIEENKEV